MPIPRYIATLALMPKSALNKYWQYIEGALYMYMVYISTSFAVSVKHPPTLSFPAGAVNVLPTKVF